jgi:hydrogenase maturation protease
VAVIGIGNVLMGDDAAGPCMVKMVEAQCLLPERVTLLDGGTAGLALPGLMEEYGAVIVVDTVHTGAAPGTVHRYDREALLSTPGSRALTPHDPGLRDALLLSELTGNNLPDLVLIGVVPEQTAAGVGLSPAVRDAMDTLVHAVVAELARLGVAVVWREKPPDPDLWWERSP